MSDMKDTDMTICTEIFESLHDGSQTKAILHHLMTAGPITVLDAQNRYRCYRLGARIWDLRHLGVDIDTRRIKTSGGASIAEYKLREKDNA